MKTAQITVIARALYAPAAIQKPHTGAKRPVTSSVSCLLSPDT